MANQQSAKLSQPGVGALDDPATLVTPQLAPVFISSLFVVFPIGDNQFDSALAQSFAQRIRVIGTVGNHALRLLSRAALSSGDANFGERGFRKRNFIGRGTFQPYSQGKTFTVDQYHPLCALATLGFTDGCAPFFAGAKLPSRKVSSHLSSPSSSKPLSNARHAASHTPASSHCFSRRQQVEGEGNSSGKKRHAAPVCSIHKIASKHGRFGAHGRPRLSFRRGGAGNNGSIKSHCSLLNSFCRFFMTEVRPFTSPHVST